MSQQTMHPAAVPDAAVPPPRHRLALAILLICQLMLILDATVMNVALPKIQDSLRFSAADLSWVINSYTLAYGGLLLLGGRMGDILGRRRMFLAGITLFTLASLAGGFATSAAWLLAARVLQGVGAAAAGPSTIALITTTFTEARERIRALALFSAVASTGFAIGLIVGGLLTGWVSWRAVLFINVPFGLAAVLLTPRYVREPERHPNRLDLPGAVTATAGMAGVVYAFIHAASAGWSSRQTIAPLVVGAVLLIAFLIIEMRARQPLLRLGLFADHNRAAGFANFFLGAAAMSSMFFFLTQFLQVILGFGALATGVAFLPFAGALFALSRIIPRLLPRVGPKPLAVSGAVVVFTGLAWLTQLSPDSGYLTDLLGPMLLLGVGGGLSMVPLNPVIMSSVPPQDAGTAGGVLQTMQQAGGTLGLAILVTVFGNAVRDAGGPTLDATPSPHALVAGMTAAFAGSAAITVCVFLVALTFRRLPTERGAGD